MNIITVNAVLLKLMLEHGYFTYMPADLQDCQSCGVAGVPKKYGNKFIFYHMQDEEGSVGEDGAMHNPMYLSWGEDVDFEVVRKAFAEVGITVSGGDRAKRILIEV
jgi:hypothetical protein